MSLCMSCRARLLCDSVSFLLAKDMCYWYSIHWACIWLDEWHQHLVCKCSPSSGFVLRRPQPLQHIHCLQLHKHPWLLIALHSCISSDTVNQHQGLLKASHHVPQCQLHTRQRLLMPFACSRTCLTCLDMPQLPADCQLRKRCEALSTHNVLRPDEQAPAAERHRRC